MEGVQLVVVSIVSNTVVFGIFVLLRFSPLRLHSPSLARLMNDPRGYILMDDNRLAYVAAWGILLVTLASLLAAAIAQGTSPLGWLSGRFAPTISDESAWHRYFRTNVPQGCAVFVGCEMQDGSYISGQLAWFNTDAEESPNRDLSIAPPFVGVSAHGKSIQFAGHSRVVLSARDIRRIYVSYVDSTRLEKL